MFLASVVCVCVCVRACVRACMHACMHACGWLSSMYTCVYRCQCVQLQEQAELHWCASSLKHSFSRWHVQLLERKALKFSKVLLLSRYFHLWNSHRKLIQHNTLSAESFYTEVSNILSECYIRVFMVVRISIKLLALSAKN